MKRTQLIMDIAGLVTLLLLAGCTTTQPNNPGQDLTAPNSRNLRVAELALPGMFCQACAQGSETTLRNMPGVIEANVDIAAKKGIVIYDAGQITKEQLVSDGLIQAYDGKIISDEEYKSRGIWLMRPEKEGTTSTI